MMNIDIDINKKVQEQISEIINKSLEGVSDGFIDDKLLELLRAILTQTYYLGFRQGLNVHTKVNEIVIKNILGGCL